MSSRGLVVQAGTGKAAMLNDALSISDGLPQDLPESIIVPAT
jgi:hypothetical protein